MAQPEKRSPKDEVLSALQEVRKPGGGIANSSSEDNRRRPSGQSWGSRGPYCSWSLGSRGHRLRTRLECRAEQPMRAEPPRDRSAKSPRIGCAVSFADFEDSGLDWRRSVFWITSSAKRPSLRQHFNPSDGGVAVDRNKAQNQLALRIRLQAGKSPDHNV